MASATNEPQALGLGKGWHVANARVHTPLLLISWREAANTKASAIHTRGAALRGVTHRKAVETLRHRGVHRTTAMAPIGAAQISTGASAHLLQRRLLRLRSC